MPTPQAPGASDRDLRPRNPSCLCLAATSPCPRHFVEPPASKNPVPLPWLRPVHSLHIPQAGAAPGSDAASTATLLSTACPAPLSTHTCCWQRLCRDNPHPPPFFHPKDAIPRGERGAWGVLTAAARTEPSASTQWAWSPSRWQRLKSVLSWQSQPFGMGLSTQDCRIRPLGRPQGVSVGDHTQGWGAKAALWPCGAAAPLGLLPVNAGRIFLNPPKIVWECGSPCKPQG